MPFRGAIELFKKILPRAAAPDPNEPVTILTLQAIMEPRAEVIRSRLEVEGIPCFITRERTYHIGSLLLRVRRKDADKARAIIEEAENTPIEED